VPRRAESARPIVPDDDLLRRLRDAVESSAGIDPEELVAAAWEDAATEAKAVLQAVMTKALLEGAAAALQPARSSEASRPPRVPPAESGTSAPIGAGSGDPWVWYLYGVTRAGAPMPEVRGVDDYEVVSITAGGLQAIASRVPFDDFNEDTLAERVTDMEWLSTQAQAHEAVLAAAVSGPAVLPLRFGTVYRSPERVVQFLTDQAHELKGQLDRLTGCHEWSVKLLADDVAIARWAAEHEPDVVAVQAEPTKGEGHSYFARKRREQAVDEARERLVNGVVDECHDQLSRPAVQATTARPQDPSLSGYEGRMVLNGIYLVQDVTLPAFRERVEQLEQRLGPRGFSFALTGPWPAHHFVDMAAMSTAGTGDSVVR
jgi:hypothetical protein